MNLSTPIYRLAAIAALFIAAPTVSAAFFVSVDTASELSGTFQVFGFGSIDEHPAQFSALPIGSNTLRATRDFGNAFVFTTATGLPDNPRINAFTAQGPWFATGRYDNGGLSQNISVDWTIQFINYNPSSNDHMEGFFSFTLAAVPEPAETAAVIGAGLVAFAVVCRNRRRAVRADV